MVTGGHKQEEFEGNGDNIKKQSIIPKYCKKYVFFDIKTGK